METLTLMEKLMETLMGTLMEIQVMYLRLVMYLLRQLILHLKVSDTFTVLML